MSTELKLKTSDVAGVQEFGSAVALSGDYAIVGARHGGFDPGAAYVFVKNGAGWVEQAKLSASDTTAFDHFGEAVGIDGDYAIVGASQAGIGSYGQAYIFYRNGSEWVEDTILFASDKADYALFGQSVSLSGDWAIVGSDKAAHMFQRTGSTWTEKAKLTADEATDFGRSVSINGNYAVVGATNINQSPQIGAAYVFHLSGDTWQQQAVLIASDGTTYDYFGWSVSISGDYIIVGAPGANASGMIEPGAAYIFWRSGSVWIQQIKLEPTAPHKVKDFGRAVAISGSHAVAIVGDPGDNEVAVGNGAAYLFERNGLTWSLTEKIITRDAALFDNFGASVAVENTSGSGVLVVVGAPCNNDSRVDEGAAYIFSEFPPALFGFQLDPDRFMLVARILFGLTGGGGGLTWQAGTGSVPVDSEPFKLWSALSSTKRDLLFGLALSEMADLIHDRKSRQAMKTMGVNLMKTAASQMRDPIEG